MKADTPMLVQCAHSMCQHSAVANIKLATGRANVCRHHYDFHAQAAADDFCRSEGLDTQAQKYAYVRAKSPRFAGPERQPGEDDE